MVKRFHEIKLKGYIRGYTYVARVSNFTGKLLFIKAGCRKWSSFQQAKLHYEISRWWGTTPTDMTNMFSNRAHVNLSVQDIPDHIRNNIAFRHEAVSILRRLEMKVIKYSNRVKNRQRRLRRGR